MKRKAISLRLPRVAILSGLLGFAGCVQPGTVGGRHGMMSFYVAPDGRDVNRGTEDKPFATLERAQDAIRAARKRGLPAGGVTVWIRGGTYERTQPFELGTNDSGTAECPILYRAMTGETVRLSGGRAIPASAFTPVTDDAVLRRLEPEARAAVRCVNLKSLGVAEFGRMAARGFGHPPTPLWPELFFNDQPMTLACWPNQGFVLTGRVLDSGVPVVPPGKTAKPVDPALHRGTFTVPGDRIARWVNAEDLWVYGYYCWDWADEYLPVESVDVARKTLTLGRAHLYGLREGHRFRVLNALEELDQPGEWCLDRKAGLLYFWPPASLEQATTVVSQLAAPLVSLNGTSHVTLRGLIFEAGRDGGVRIIGGSHNRVAGCIVRNVGITGVQIGDVSNGNPIQDARGGVCNGIESCEIYNTGGAAVVLAGGDRKTLQAAGNFAVNNHLHHFARIDRTYSPAVALDGVGNRVAHNRIHDAPHVGVLFGGNEHVMEFNDAYNLCQETSDAGAFYIGRDWSMRGNILRYNFIHDIGAYAASRECADSMAIYLDDWTSGITVQGNIISRVRIGVMIGGGNHNTVNSNVFVDCSSAAVHLDARGLGWAKNYFNGEDNTLFNRIDLVNYRNPPYSERYPELARIREGNPAVPKGNRIEHNIKAGGAWLVLPNRLDETAVAVGENLVFSKAGEAGFVSPAGNDFRLGDNSPVRQKWPAFRLPVEKIGLYPDECRAEVDALCVQPSRLAPGR